VFIGGDILQKFPSNHLLGVNIKTRIRKSINPPTTARITVMFVVLLVGWIVSGLNVLGASHGTGTWFPVVGDWR
jgi:hypothetical protein